MEQSVAHASNSFDPARLPWIVPQFVSQVRHVDLSGALFSVTEVTSHVVFVPAELTHQI